MLRLVKPDRSGKPRIFESKGGKPVIVEYGNIYIYVCIHSIAQANGIQSTSKRYKYTCYVY